MNLKMLEAMANAKLKQFIDAEFSKLSNAIKQEFQPRTLATLWYRYAKDSNGTPSWEYNHLEIGHCMNDFPTPKVPAHEQIWKGKWAKAFVQLDYQGCVHPYQIIC